MQDWSEVQKSWVEKNPVRCHRKSIGMSIFTCASVLGVTTTTIQQWESGASTPSDDNMEKVARWSGNADAAAHWKEWSEARPAYYE